MTLVCYQIIILILSIPTEGTISIFYSLMETVTDFIFLGSKIIADGDCSYEMKMLAPWKKHYDKPRQHIKKQRHHFTNKGPYSQSCGFSSSYVGM